MELYLMVNAARGILAAPRPVQYLGLSFTELVKRGSRGRDNLLDEPLIRLWDAPVKTAALSW